MLGSVAASALLLPCISVTHSRSQETFEPVLPVQVQELEEKLASLSGDLAEQRAAVQSAQQSAGEAAQERISALQTQVEEAQIERDQMQTDVHSLQHELQDQDRRYREVCSSDA